MPTKECVVSGWELDKALEEVLLRVKETEEKRREIARRLRSLNNYKLPAGFSSDDSLIIPVRKIDKIEATVAAVDSGFLGEEFHALDLVMIRSVAVVFKYNGGTKLEGVEYYPTPAPSARLLYSMEPIDSFEFENLASIERMYTELKLAMETLERYQLDFLLLDGSLLPRYVFETLPRGETLAKLNLLFRTYEELYEICREKKISLVGVVKDCRSNHFVRLLDQLLEKYQVEMDPELRNFMKRLRDTVLLDALLSVGERTFSFRCSEEQPVYAFYLKTVPEDRPLRIEFLEGAGTVDRIAEVLYAISAHHPSYAVPAPLVEADVRAHLFKEEMELVHENLIHLSGFSSILELRRERKPF